MYSDDQMDQMKKVTVNVKDEVVEKVLDLIYPVRHILTRLKECDCDRDGQSEAVEKVKR